MSIMRTLEFCFRIAIFISLSSSTSSSASDTSGTNNNDAGNWSAGKLRAAADEAMMAGDTSSAVEYLHRAIDMEPSSAINHFKLYRLYNRKHQFDNAEKYITLAAELDPAKYQGYKAKALFQAGQCDRAVEEYYVLVHKNIQTENQVVEDPDYIKANHCVQYAAAAQKAYDEQSYSDAAAYYQELQQFIPQNIDIVWPKAISLYNIQDYYGVISETGRLLKHQPKNIDAYRLRGDAYHRLGEHDNAIAHYREGLKLDPEHKQCKAGHKHTKALDKKRSKGKEAFDKKDYDKAIELWMAAIQIDPSHTAFNRPLQLQMVLAYSRAGKHAEAIQLAQSHVEYEESVEGMWALGEAQQSADQFELAVRTFQQAVEIANEAQKQDAQQKLQNAQVALKQSKEKNYYKILGLHRSANKKEIKKGYRELALKWHPDKNLDNKEEAEKMFQDISEAYEVLSDDELKAKYDRGEEVFDNQGGGGGRQDPNQFFQQHFFHNGGGGGQQRFHVKFG